MERYYFDHNATTPVRPEVIEAMLPYLSEHYGNASSVHGFGNEAKKGLEESRGRVATLIGADPDEIYFTAGGTESDNIAIEGHVRARTDNRRGIVTTAIEHSAVLKTAERLAQDGFEATIVGVDNRSIVSMDELATAVSDGTALVSMMYANNETGTVQDIVRAAEIAHAAGAYFHTDAVQAVGKLPLDVHEFGIDMLAMSGHKFNAVKGIGALYIRRDIPVAPIMTGGGHENGLRPGTENVPGAVALATALELAIRDRDATAATLGAMRDRLETGIERTVAHVGFNGRGAPRLANTANISIPGIDGEALVMGLNKAGIAVSSGSACSTHEVVPSHVLIAMGVDPRTAQSSLRFSLGHGTEESDIDHVLTVLPQIVERLRSVSAGV
jgi:cysteine desulfurase